MILEAKDSQIFLETNVTTCISMTLQISISPEDFLIECGALLYLKLLT